jgi:transketolase
LCLLEHSTHEWTGDKYGRVLHFGIREHAMGSIPPWGGHVLHATLRRHFLDLQRDYMRAWRFASLR